VAFDETSTFGSIDQPTHSRRLEIKGCRRFIREGTVVLCQKKEQASLRCCHSTGGCPRLRPPMQAPLTHIQ
jgi:hypothetical protein